MEYGTKRCAPSIDILINEKEHVEWKETIQNNMSVK